MLLQINLILDNFIFYSYKGYKFCGILNEQMNIVQIFKLKSNFPYDKLYYWVNMEKFLAYSKCQQLLFLWLLLFLILLKIVSANC